MWWLAVLDFYNAQQVFTVNVTLLKHKQEEVCLDLIPTFQKDAQENTALPTVEVYTKHLSFHFLTY